MSSSPEDRRSARVGLAYEERIGESHLENELPQVRAFDEEFVGSHTANAMIKLIIEHEEECISQREKIEGLEGEVKKLNLLLKDSDEKLKIQMTQLIQAEDVRKKLHNIILELKGNIRVFCRVRPSLQNNESRGTEEAIISYSKNIEHLGRGINLMHNGQKHSFIFDKVFDHEASQDDVFFEISQLVQSALDGYKVCIFAYGQTGSGKTYTMMGKPDTHEQKGLIPRSLEQIFETSQAVKYQGWEYKMQVSMLEIYNDTIRDLLSPTSHIKKQYTIKHDSAGDAFIPNLSVVDVRDINEVSFLLNEAVRNRYVGMTQMNEQSSRSHFVFTMRISSVNNVTEQVQGVLNLVDLAGSERLAKSGSTGDRLKETQAINKSLSCLSDVIFAIANKDDHVPYRNSKLTHLLQPCLGGNSKTLMFVNISQEASSANESLCSLRFADRVNTCQPRRHTQKR